MAVGGVILLAIESATDTVGAAIVRDDDGEAERTHVGGRAHAEHLAPAIEEVCALSGCQVHDIDQIAVDIGPGLFTGLRVGVATAKALAHALGTGVLGVGSLDILAAAVSDRGDGEPAGPVVAVVDARRGEVFAAAYQFGRPPDGPAVAGRGPVDPAMVRQDHPEPMTPPALEAWLVELAEDGARVTVVGDGAVRYRDRLSAHGWLDLGLADELSAPPPLAQAHLAHRRLVGGTIPQAPADVVPDYRRAADARINWEQRVPGGGPDRREGPGPVRAGPDRPRSPVAVVIAPMRTRDLRGVLRIEEAVFPQPWSHRLFVEELAQRKSRAYRAAWVGRAIVGFAGQMFVDDEAHVNNIAVDPDWQGRGLGAALLVDLVRTGVQRGVRHLTLEVRVGNDPALALYRRFGLAPVGVRRNYYPATGEDALVMWARDIDSEAYAERLAAIEESLLGDLEVTARR